LFAFLNTTENLKKGKVGSLALEHCIVPEKEYQSEIVIILIVVLAT